MYGRGRGSENPHTLKEGLEELRLMGRTEASPFKTFIPQRPRTLQLLQIAKGLVGGKEPVLGRTPQAGLKRGQGRALGVDKTPDPVPPGKPQLWIPFLPGESCWSVLMNRSFPFSILSRWLLPSCSAHPWSSGPHSSLSLP